MPINDVANATFSKTLYPLALLLVPLSAPVTAGVVALVPGAVVARTDVVMVAVVSPSVVVVGAPTAAAAAAAEFRSGTPPWNKATTTLHGRTCLRESVHHAGKHGELIACHFDLSAIAIIS